MTISTGSRMVDIQRLGANARAQGQPVFENPYLKVGMTPGATGEPLEIWRAKHEAWEIGWRVEDLIRSQSPEVGLSGEGE